MTSTQIRLRSALAVSFLALSISALTQTIPPAVKAAEASIDPEKIRAHVKFLADDLLEGRGPGLRGSEIAAKYIATQFALYGLKPGGDNGTYLQQINMVGMNAIADKTTMSIIPPKRPDGQIGIMLYSFDLKYGDDYTVSNRTLTPTIDIDAPIVFVGYGITAPEFNWNDYADIDVKGKVIVCIVGDPPSTIPTSSAAKPSPTTAAGPTSSNRPRAWAPSAPSSSTRPTSPATAGTSSKTPTPAKKPSSATTKTPNSKPQAGSSST